MKKTIIRSLVVAALGVSAISLTGCEVKAKEYVAGSAVKVGLICLHDSTSTYDKNFIDALGQAAKNLGAKVDGDPIVKTGVNEDQSCYNAAKDLVKQGCNVIFADSFGHEQFMLKAAKKWPQVQFCHATGTQALTAKQDNFHNAFASIYEGRFLAGYAAGLKLQSMESSLTANNKDADGNIKLGYVGAWQYAEVISGFTSWFLGVKAVVPNVVMDVQFTKSWYDEPAEAAAAQTLIDRGCALISQHADSMGAPNTCETAKVPNITYNIETAASCPNTYIGYSRINWAPYYEAVVNAMYGGTAIAGEKNGNWTGTIGTGSVEYNAKDPVAKAACELVKAELVAGTRKVFDCANFTVKGEHLTSYKADVQDMGDYVPETEVIKSAGSVKYFDESSERSAPYFDIIIDGITLLNSGF